MSLDYTSSNLVVGNGVFGLTGSDTTACWGFCFVDLNRFALTLVSDGANLFWKKIDVLSTTVAFYDMLYTPADAGIEFTDSHPVKGNFLWQDSDMLYYLKEEVLHQRNITTGASVGTKTLRSILSANIDASTIDHIAVKGNEVYAVSGSLNKLYHWTVSVWDAGTVDASEEVTVSELTASTLDGLFTQPGADTDIIVLTKGSAKQALKYTSTLTRVGESLWDDPSTNISATVFRGSILYFLANDEITAGIGLYFYRFGDGSTNIIAPVETVLTISASQIKAGNLVPLTITFTARDGYGVPFQPTDPVRFSILRQGSAFDTNDGALAITSVGPFRDSIGNPINTQLDLYFDAGGSAVAYWQAPLVIPTDTVLHRIKIDYPLPS